MKKLALIFFVALFCGLAIMAGLIFGYQMDFDTILQYLQDNSYIPWILVVLPVILIYFATTSIKW